MTGLVGSDVSVEMRDHPLGQVIRLNLVRDGQLLQFRHKAPVAADDTTDEPFVPEMIEALVFTVALTGGIDEGEIAWIADRLQVLLVGRQIPCLQRDCDFLGESDADEPSSGHSVAIADQHHGIRCRYDLAVPRALKCGQQWMRRMRHGPMLPLLIAVASDVPRIARPSNGPRVICSQTRPVM
jgi:hypothetical protein